MGKIWTLLLVAGLLGGCSTIGGLTSRVTGLFGGDEAQPAARAETVPAEVAAAAPDPTVLLPNVELLAADRGRQGVILRAEGMAPTQGYHSPELRSLGAVGADGLATVELRAAPPAEPHPVGAPATRVLSVGRFYSNRELRDIRSFRIVAAGNALATPVPAAPASPPPPAPEF